MELPLRHEGVAEAAAVRGLESARRYREVERLGEPRHVRVAGRTHGDRIAAFRTAAAGPRLPTGGRSSGPPRVLRPRREPRQGPAPPPRPEPPPARSTPGRTRWPLRTGYSPGRAKGTGPGDRSGRSWLRSSTGAGRSPRGLANRPAARGWPRARPGWLGPPAVPVPWAARRRAATPRSRRFSAAPGPTAHRPPGSRREAPGRLRRGPEGRPATRRGPRSAPQPPRAPPARPGPAKHHPPRQRLDYYLNPNCHLLHSRPGPR
jgi:hypothetical protein